MLEANRQWTACCGFVVPDAETERYLIFPESLTSCRFLSGFDIYRNGLSRYDTSLGIFTKDCAFDVFSCKFGVFSTMCISACMEAMVRS